MNTTDKIVKMRECAECALELEQGVWYSGFTAAKNYAKEHDRPFVAVWSNGQECSHCINFEKVMLTETLKKALAGRRYVLYIGLNVDKSKDDKLNGKAWKWIYQKGKAKRYPMIRLWWDSEDIDVTTDGDNLRGRKTGQQGARNIAKKLAKVFGE